MPSIWPARPPPCSRTRSPMRNGRAAISTTPAIRLPSVCWAARPKTTAVIAPPTASVRGSSPAMRSAESARDGQERQPDQERHRPRRTRVDPPEQRGLHPAAEVARQRPAEDHEHDRGDDPHGRVDAEDSLAHDVADDRQRHERDDQQQLPPRVVGALDRVQRDRARPLRGRPRIELGSFAIRASPQPTLPGARGFHPQPDSVARIARYGVRRIASGPTARFWP